MVLLLPLYLHYNIFKSALYTPIIWENNELLVLVRFLTPYVYI